MQLHEYSLQPATGLHYKYILETVFLSLKLQPCSPEFLTSANTDAKKNVSSRAFWNISKSARKKVYNEAIWLDIYFNKNYFMHFSRDAGKTAVKKILENY